jgi:hypothetical protein
MRATERILNPGVTELPRTAPACAPIRLLHKESVMNPFVAVGVLLLAIWAVLWLGFHIVSGLIHLLVVIAVISIVWGLVKRGASAVSRNV